MNIVIAALQTHGRDPLHSNNIAIQMFLHSDNRCTQNQICCKLKTRGWALARVHKQLTQAWCHLIAFNVFTLYDPVTLTLVNEDLWRTNCISLWQVWQYCSFSRFGFIVRTDRQTDRHTRTQTRLNALLPRLSSACMSNDQKPITTWHINWREIIFSFTNFVFSFTHLTVTDKICQREILSIMF